MPESLTLEVYLEKRGSVKALTRIEAEVFGVPYPLQKGWAHRHGVAPITQDMLDALLEKIGRAKSSTAEKAQRGLNGVRRDKGLVICEGPRDKRNITAGGKADGKTEAKSFFGLTLRAARRYARRRVSSEGSTNGAK